MEGSGKWLPGSRKDSFASHHSHHSRHSYTSHGDRGGKIIKDRNREPTHFVNWTVKNRVAHPLLPEVIVDKTKSDDNVSITREISKVSHGIICKNPKVS